MLVMLHAEIRVICLLTGGMDSSDSSCEHPPEGNTWHSLLPPTHFYRALRKSSVSWVAKFKSGKKKQHKHKLFGPDFPRTFLTPAPGRPWVKKFLPITGAAEKRTFWCGRPRFLARTSMTRRVFEKLCTKEVCGDFLALSREKN